MYDWECRHVHGRGNEDVGFWLDLARAVGAAGPARGRGPVLELACGTGRVTLPLAEAGMAMVGLDHDPVMLAAMLRRCRAGAPTPLAVAADMRRFALAARFDTVFIAYNSIQLLSDPADMVACLTCARQHLAPGGRVGIEVTDFQTGAAGGPVAEERLADAGGIRLAGSLDHDLGQRTSVYRRWFSGPGWSVRDEVILRSLDRPELTVLLAAAGLQPVEWWTERSTLRVVAAPADCEPWSAQTV